MKRLLLILIVFLIWSSVKSQTISYGTESDLYSTAAVKESKVVALSSTLFVATYAITSSGAVYVRAGTLSSGTITWGTAVSVGSVYPVNIFALSSTSFFLTYSSTVYLTGRVGTVDTRTITLGTGSTIPDVLNVANVASVAVLSSTKVLISSTLAGGGVGVYICSISTRTITWGNYAYLPSSTTIYFSPSIAAISSTTALLTSAEFSTNCVHACVVDIGSDLVEFGTIYTFSNSLTLNSRGSDYLLGTEIVDVDALSSSSFVLSYSYFNYAGSTNNIKCVLLSVSGTTVSLGSSYTVYSRSDASNDIQYFNTVPLSSTNFMTVYNDVSTSSPKIGLATISSGNISENYYTIVTGNTVSGDDVTSNFYVYPSSSSAFMATYGKSSYYQYVNSATITYSSSKKRYGITISKWNGISPSKINGI